MEPLLNASPSRTKPKPVSPPNLDTLERELEDVLLNTFMNHDLFSEHFPLKVKIDVSNNTSLCKSLQKENHKQVHVKLNVSDNISSVSQHPSIRHHDQKGSLSANVINIEDSCDEEEAEDVDYKKPAPGLHILNDDIMDTDTDSEGDATAESVEDGCARRHETIQSLLRSTLKRKTDSEEDQEENKMNFKKIAVNKDKVKKKVVEVLLPSVNIEKDEFMEMESGLETHKGKKNFTLDQDKEILDKVIELLPDKRLPDLELPDQALKLLSKKLSRLEISIQQRWKYSLRAWIVDFNFNSKATKSWDKSFSKKASVQRRKDVVEYFCKLVKKNNLELEVMNVKTKPVMNMKTEPVKIEKTKPVKVKKVKPKLPLAKSNLIHSINMTKKNRY